MNQFVTLQERKPHQLIAIRFVVPLCEALELPTPSWPPYIQDWISWAAARLIQGLSSLLYWEVWGPPGHLVFHCSRHFMFAVQRRVTARRLPSLTPTSLRPKVWDPHRRSQWLHFTRIIINTVVVNNPLPPSVIQRTTPHRYHRHRNYHLHL